MKSDMRIVVTKRMLREGLLRCMETKPVSKITVSDLCRESGINRSTFYNHYDTPVMILRDIAYEYAGQLSLIYADNYTNRDEGDDAALEKCLEYIAERKAEIKLLFSGNAEQYLAGFCLGIVNKKLEEKIADSTAEDHEESLLCAATSAAAVYGFIQIWITTNIDKSPKELVRILKKVVRSDIFL